MNGKYKRIKIVINWEPYLNLSEGLALSVTRQRWIAAYRVLPRHRLLLPQAPSWVPVGREKRDGSEYREEHTNIIERPHQLSAQPAAPIYSYF